MCGIAGIIADEGAARRALPPMVAAQVHRGPDDVGAAYFGLGDKVVGFGHRRLSILDLSPAGHQPMFHPGTGDCIIFNGEIYNFAELRKELEGAGETFRGHCDTEVLLHGLSRWGPDYLKRLAGMFALAFYCAKTQEIILARDALGIKPLYLTQKNGFVLFASEVRAVLASGIISRELDGQGVASFLAYGAVQQPNTIFRDIQSFPPGSYQVFNSRGAAAPPVKFWDYPRPNETLTSDGAVAALQRTLDAAVRDHMVADVPVGVFLSSGIDSTVLAGLAARHTSRLRTFTVGFTDQPDMSELGLAKQTAQIFKLDHTEVMINGRDAESAAVEWFASLDQPSVDGLNVYVISKAVRGLGITVALSGQGGDELFGGYPSFADVPRLHDWLERIAWLPMGARRMVARAATMGRSKAVRQKLLDIIATDGSLRDVYFQRRRAMSNGQLLRLGISPGKLSVTNNFISPEVIADIHLDEGDPPWCVSRLESQFYQGSMLLRDSDTNGMAHSLEIRVPILDQRVVDLAFTIPGHVRMPTRDSKKYLLKTSFKEFLRPELLAQGKRGFTLPIGRWMSGPLRALCEQALADLKKVNLLSPQGIDTIWGAYLQEPASPIWSRAFMLVVFGTYLRQAGLVR